MMLGDSVTCQLESLTQLRWDARQSGIEVPLRDPNRREVHSVEPAGQLNESDVTLCADLGQNLTHRCYRPIVVEYWPWKMGTRVCDTSQVESVQHAATVQTANRPGLAETIREPC